MKISVCIPTHRRNDRLRELLEDLDRQEVMPAEVIVVDNDAAGGARPVVDAFLASQRPFELLYAIQPERSIPLTRNMTVKLATGDWLAFVDDDERAPPPWLRLLRDCALKYQADGVLAPVRPILPGSAPAWMHRGRFYDWPRLPTGTVLPTKNLRFGNLMLRGAAVRALPGPFDPAFGLAAGEDVDMLVRMVNAGARLVWCDEAEVTEDVVPTRLSLRWLLMRGYSGGQAYGWIRLSGTMGAAGTVTRIRLLFLWSGQLLVALLLAALTLPFGRHRTVAWLIKAWANAGKLTTFAGLRYRAYA